MFLSFSSSSRVQGAAVILHCHHLVFSRAQGETPVSRPGPDHDCDDDNHDYAYDDHAHDYRDHDPDTVVDYRDDDILQGEAVSEKLTQRWEGGNKP